ncbi:MAG: PQQ-binding-like beta-propeller repeat protein [Verrucomicrobiaceae bacterium]|jgi:outer membrane protein assembly factor BamB|nr:PQQ-binding-like beta-propeller repeat protein [Verrucomicrobiaceae bacterium]NCF90393.1 PQQ-binding-like beta-propeller repeat protein [Verrucomicrobiaceae bacterium]
MRTVPVLSLLILVQVLWCADSEAQEWTRFRGPNGSGISKATGIPVTWTDSDYNWKIDLPVKGSSSPVLWGSQIFLTGDDPEKKRRSILCIDADSGRVQWRRDYTFDDFYLHRDNDFASATPCVDQDGVIVVWSTPKQVLMIALGLDGKEKWRRDLGPFRGLHGSASSPIIADGLVLLANDQMNPKRFSFYLPEDTDWDPGKSFLIALERTTGKTRWKIDRKSELAGYATPCIRRIGDRAEAIFTSTAHGITAVDLKSGQISWEIDQLWDDRTVSSPQLHDDLVLGSFGQGLSGQRLVAVRPNKAGGAKGELVYDVTKSVPLVPSFVVKDDLLFLWTDGGIVTCLEASTGEVHWRERVGRSCYSSPLWIDRRIYGISKRGEVVVLAASREFEELGRVDLCEKTFATPAIAGGVMYLRTQSRLYSLGKAK